ncbi:MAG: OmpA family protein [Thermovirgaceae bacterium]
MRARRGLLLGILAALMVIWVIPVSAEEMLEHPLIRPFPGSVLAENMSKYVRFEAFDFPVRNPETSKKEKHTVKGEYRYLLYEVRRENGERVTDISRLEFFENFKAAALKQGGEIKCEDPLVFTIPREDGGMTWCQVAPTASMGQTYLTIVDEKALETSLVFGPVEMKKALDAEGKIVLYDILFDYDKATLQQFSDKQLQHVLTLLAENPELHFEIQGHTDGDGSEEYNQKLSQRRAESVLNYLLLFGIEPSRLQAKGYGESLPVASNDTDKNKAKNRRVVLLKMNQ